MQKIVLIILSFTLSSAFAAKRDFDAEFECYENLTQNLRSDSSFKEYQLDELVSRDFGRDFVGQSIRAIRNYLDDINCSSRAVNFGHASHGRVRTRCSELDKGNSSSQICYVGTNLGYFFVTVNYLNSIQILFNRWD